MSRPKVKQSLRTLFWGLIALAVAGCGWFNDGEGVILNPKDDYLDSTEHQDLVVPQDLKGLQDTDPFPIPDTPLAENPSYYPERPPLPDAIYANEKRDEVRLQRLGERRWLVIPEPPTTAWPKLKQFLAENGVAIAFDAPEVGRLNTQWLKLEATSYRDVVRSITRDAKDALSLDLGQDRFLIKVEQGLRPRTTEIHLRHENDSVSIPERDDVEALETVISHVTQAEADLLNEIGAYVAAKVSEQTVSKVALQIGSNQKAELARSDEGFPILRLFLDYERAWATLGQALANAEVDITNLDRSSGLFYVELTEEVFGGKEAGSGFFCRITFSCDADNQAYKLQISLESTSDHFTIRVLDQDGTLRIDPELAQQVLVLIREYAA
ncbi:MAG: outer membrane protein assembly factor BamC [Pseudomonadota bacterium]